MVKLGGIQANLLPALDALLQERSVTRAAGRLGISQPAMSHSLARLRDHFDDPLLVQRGRAMVLTTKAASLLDAVAAASQAMAGVFEAPLAFDPRASRRFVVASADLFALRSIPPILRTLQRDAPGVVLELTPLSARSTEEILTGGVELAFGAFEDVPESLNQQHLFRDPYVCLVRETHPRVKKTLSLDTFVGLEHLEVLPAPNARPGARIERALAAEGMTRKVTTRIPYFLLAARMIAESDQVLTMTRAFALELCKLAPLRVVPCPVKLAPLRFSQIWLRSRDADPAHRFVRDLCARTIVQAARSVSTSEARRGS